MIQNPVLVAFIAMVFGLFALTSQVTAGALDPSFGVDGKVTTDLGGDARAVAIQTNGQIVALGRPSQGDFALVRYNNNGTLDMNFGTNGIVLTDFGDPFDEASGIAIQPDGKIVAAGAAGFGNFALSRYNSDGSLDPSFGIDGKVLTDFGGGDRAFAVAIQADGRIIAAGHIDNPSLGIDSFAIARYNEDGSLDSNFGVGGKVTTDFGGYDVAHGISVQLDNNIVVAGSGGPNNDFVLCRFTPNGSLDISFGIGGKVSTDFGSYDSGNDIAIQGDGKIILAGTGDNRFALARYNIDGNLDATFHGDGKVVTEFFGENIERANGLAVQSDGKIIVVGVVHSDFDESFALARYKNNGFLDMSFGIGGKITTDFGDPSDVGILCPPARKDCSTDVARDVAIQSDGKIVVVGGAGASMPPSMFAISRYLPEFQAKFSWLMFIPAITGGACIIDPLWGVYTTVCCLDSSLTFSVTVSGETMQSTATSCALEPTWEGWEDTMAGEKSVYWQINSPTCGTYDGTFPLDMDKGKSYLFQLELVDDELVIFVYVGNACSIVNNTPELESGSPTRDAVDNKNKSLQKMKEIRLNIPFNAFRINE